MLILRAQESRILVQNDFDNSADQTIIQLKWYSSVLIYPEGVNLYRRESGQTNWIKVNDEPILMDNAIGDELIAGDSTMELLVEGVRQATAAELQESFLLLNVVIKSFQDNQYAKFLGIYYEDNKVEAGKTYQYRFYKLNNGREVLMEASDFVQAGTYQADVPVEDFEVFQEDQNMYLNWKPDDDRFYAVNIYRTASDSLEEKILNQRPVLLSQVEDSLGNLVYPDPKFQDRKLRENISYTYQIEGLGFFQRTTRRTRPVTVYLNDVTAPPPPTDFTGKADSMEVHLNWLNPTGEDIKEIRVMRSMMSDGPFEAVFSTLDQQNYTDKPSIPGPYYYYVASYDHAENEAASRKAFIEVQDVFPPAQPKGLTIASDTGFLFLNWEANSEPDLAGYLLYRTVDTDRKDHYVLLNDQPLDTTAFQQALPQNVKNKFFYYIVAVDTSYNRSPKSDFATGQMPDIIGPETPFLKQISYQENTIIIEWVPNVDSDLMGYRLLRADSVPEQTYLAQNEGLLSASVTRYVDQNTRPNHGYLYQLVAMDSAGLKSPHSNPLYAYRLVEENSEEGRISLEVKARKKKRIARLDWKTQAPEDLLGYVVYRGATENVMRPFTGLVQEVSLTDRDILLDQVVYQVRAYMPGGTIIKSEIKTLQFK